MFLWLEYYGDLLVGRGLSGRVGDVGKGFQDRVGKFGFGI